jgi:Zn-finger nucleic acid-binding protein
MTHAARGETRAMNCPKCRSPFEQVATRDGTVDRCTGCKGLWFEMLEHEDQKPHAAAIDTGDAALGARHNANDRIHCPACANSPLIRMVDASQPHIWFESCPVCYGRFYDAGEFRDFAELTFREFLRGLTPTARD